MQREGAKRKADVKRPRGGCPEALTFARGMGDSGGSETQGEIRTGGAASQPCPSKEGPKVANEFTFKKMKPSDFVVALSDDEGTRIGYPYKVVAIWRDQTGGVGITVELPDGCGAGLNEGEYTPLHENRFPEYETKIGEAGDGYIRSVAYKGRHTLPAMFRWEDLWRVMNEASKG